MRPVRDPWKMRRQQPPPVSWPAVGRITASLESLWIRARRLWAAGTSADLVNRSRFPAGIATCGHIAARIEVPAAV